MAPKARKSDANEGVADVGSVGSAKGGSALVPALLVCILIVALFAAFGVWIREPANLRLLQGQLCPECPASATSTCPLEQEKHDEVASSIHAPLLAARENTINTLASFNQRLLQVADHFAVPLLRMQRLENTRAMRMENTTLKYNDIEYNIQIDGFDPAAEATSVSFKLCDNYIELAAAEGTRTGEELETEKKECRQKVESALFNQQMTRRRVGAVPSGEIKIPLQFGGPGHGNGEAKWYVISFDANSKPDMVSFDFCINLMEEKRLVIANFVECLPVVSDFITQQVKDQIRIEEEEAAAAAAAASTLTATASTPKN